MGSSLVGPGCLGVATCVLQCDPDTLETDPPQSLSIIDYHAVMPANS
jgi:hypothetical protein